nr:hypothetical protein [Halocatena marina]
MVLHTRFDDIFTRPYVLVPATQGKHVVRTGRRQSSNVAADPEAEGIRAGEFTVLVFEPSVLSTGECEHVATEGQDALVHMAA